MRNRSDLRPGQVKAVDHVFERDEGMLVLDCGGGKTVTFLTAIADWLEEGVIDRAILAAPPTIAREVWPQEPAKWSHLSGLTIIDGTGSPAQRRAAFAQWQAMRNGILTVTIPNLSAIERELRLVDLSRTALVIDEVSQLGAPTGVQAKAAEALAARCAIVWGGTATPRAKGWEGLFRPIRIVSRGKVWGGRGGFEAWRRERFMPLDRNGYNWRVHSFAEKEMERDIAPLLYRVQEDKIAGLQDLREGPEFDRYTDLPDAARVRYDAMEEKLFAEVTKNLIGATAEEKVFALSRAAASMKLEQIAQGYLYDDGEAVSALHDRKLALLQELMDEVGDENLILVYRFKQDLAALHGAFGDFPFLGGGVSPRETGETMKAWNAGKLPLLGLHPASAGHGVELQNGGRRVIWYNPTWSAEQQYQTIRRVHRSGQTRVCYSHRLLVRDTVDELKVARADHNIAAQAEFIARIGQ